MTNKEGAAYSLSIDDRVENVLDAGTRIIRESYGPERPEKLNEILVSVKESLIDRFGEKAWVLDPNYIHWTSDTEISELADYYKGEMPKFLERAMNAVGVVDFGEVKPANSSFVLALTNIEPVEIYIRANAYPTIDQTDSFEGFRQQLDLASRLISTSITFAYTPRYTREDEAFTEAFEKVIDSDKRDYPRVYPHMDMDAFKILIGNLKFILREDESRLMVIQGAQVQLWHTYMESEKDSKGDNIQRPVTEALLVAGSELNEHTPFFLTERVRRDFAKSWIRKNFQDPKVQTDVTKVANKIYEPTPMQKVKLARIDTFFRAISLMGYQEVFKAYINGEILLKFAQAKRKNKKLFYPE